MHAAPTNREARPTDPGFQKREADTGHPREAPGRREGFAFRRMKWPPYFSSLQKNADHKDPRRTKIAELPSKREENRRYERGENTAPDRNTEEKAMPPAASFARSGIQEDASAIDLDGKELLLHPVPCESDGGHMMARSK